jgi:hypothetical protein
MDVAAVLPATGAQLGFALLFAALAVWRFRKMEGLGGFAAQRSTTFYDRLGARWRSTSALSIPRRRAMSVTWSSPILPTTKYFDSGCAR